MKRYTGVMVTSMLSVLLIHGCGTVVNLPGDHSGSSAPAAASTPLPSTTLTELPKTFSGAVGGAFEVTVDGAPYNDMEDFYTQELKRLPDKVQKAGYDASWTARFDAQIGLSDLWRGMTVYIAPLDPTGFQTVAQVGDDGRFAVTLPAAAIDHDYKVRANKRIDIVLTRGGDEVKICYNFSAIEHNVPFHRDSLPIVLSDFASEVTAYDCTVAAAGGIAVPHSDGHANNLAVGETKSDVTRILGLTGLSVESPTSWCWAYRPSPDSPCAAHQTGQTGNSCDCRVTFDANGIVTGLDGFAASYLPAGP